MSLATTNNATVPPEARGLARDEVRLLVARSGSPIRETAFGELAQHLAPGDLVVVNTSATLPAALDGTRSAGREVVVHLATALDDGTWVVEVRPPGPSFGPVTDLAVGERVELPGGSHLEVLRTLPGQVRLHVATVVSRRGVQALMTQPSPAVRRCPAPVARSRPRS